VNIQSNSDIKRNSVNQQSTDLRLNAGKEIEAWSDEDSKRLIAFEENSPEFTAQRRTQAILHEVVGPEYNTRSHFLSNFESNNSQIVDIRHFIDGMHEYIMEKRGIELGNIFLECDHIYLQHLIQLNGKILALLSFIVFSVVEESMFVALKRNIIEMISTSDGRVGFSYFLFHHFITFLNTPFHYSVVYNIFFIFYVYREKKDILWLKLKSYRKSLS